MPSRIEEQTGGSATYPFPSGAFTSSYRDVVGFIPSEDCSVTGITYANGVDYDTKYGLDYTTCKANVYYHFPNKITAATFDVDVSLVFE